MCLVQPPCTTQCQNAKAQPHCFWEFPKRYLWSCRYQKEINSPLAQCFKAPKLISHTNVCVEGTLQPHQCRTLALKAQASSQALSNTQSPAPLSPGKCTGDRHFRAPRGLKLGLHFLSMGLQDALTDQCKETVAQGWGMSQGQGTAEERLGLLSVRPARKSQLPI